MNHIGADVHSSSIALAVVNERGVVGEKWIETSERALREYVAKTGKPRQIIIEEGELASWVKEIMERCGERVIITDPKRNRWIGRSEQKNDRVDAKKLALLHRGGYTKEIIHPQGKRKDYREWIQYYEDLVKGQTRLKNKIKGKFRRHGIACSGKTVYEEGRQSEWLLKFPEGCSALWQVKGYMELLQNIREKISETRKYLLKMKGECREVQLFCALPGIDLIRACTFSAMVSNPHRFANKKQLWMYAGLGMISKESGGKIQTKRLSHDYNRLLKKTMKMAAKSAVQTVKDDNEFRRQFFRLTMEQGIPEHRALLTVARSMTSAMYGMWKRGQAYEPRMKNYLETKAT